MAAIQLKSRRNPKNGDWYTTLKAANSKKEMNLGEGMRRKFSEADRQRLIRHLSAAVIVYDDGKAKKIKKKPVG